MAQDRILLKNFRNNKYEVDIEKTFLDVCKSMENT